MDWTQQFDSYCERIDLTFWSEPINAVTNAAFLIAALVMLVRLRGTKLPVASLLLLLLTLIGIGSFLFHTTATAWAAVADTTPIGLFILLYLFAVGRDFLNWPTWGALLLVAGFFPYAYVMVSLLDDLPFFHISNFYWTVPVLLFVFSAPVARKDPKTAEGMLIGALLLSISISLRSFDETLCDVNPIGTHFLWHCLNAVMLAWMIEVYRRHMVGNRATPS